MRKNKVLIVDDDKEFLEELLETLRLHGYDAMGVHDSTAVLGLMRESLPDIILLDLKMDKMSGFQVAINLRQSPDFSKVPIIAMTGYFAGDYHLPLLNVCGIRTCLSKPFKPEDVITQIKTQIGKDTTKT